MTSSYIFCVILGFPLEAVCFFYEKKILALQLAQEKTQEKKLHFSLKKEKLPELFYQCFLPSSGSNNPSNIHNNSKLQDILQQVSHIVFIAPSWPGPLTALRNAVVFAKGLRMNSSKKTSLLQPSFFDLYKQDHPRKSFLAIPLGASKWIMKKTHEELYRETYGDNNLIPLTTLDELLFFSSSGVPKAPQEASQNHLSSSFFFGRQRPEHPWITLDHYISFEALEDLLQKAYSYGENHNEVFRS